MERGVCVPLPALLPLRRRRGERRRDVEVKKCEKSGEKSNLSATRQVVTVSSAGLAEKYLDDV
jgi:hypothetical protein